MADPATGALSDLVIGPEGSGWGVKATHGNLLAYRSCNMKPSQALNDNPNMRGDFNPGIPGYGKKSSSGTLALVPTITSAPFLFYWLFGNLDTTGVGDPYTHVAELASDVQIPMSLNNTIDLATDQFALSVGTRINSMTIPFGPDGFSEWSLELMAKETTYAVAATNQIDASPVDFTGGEPLDNVMIDETAGIKIGTYGAESLVTYVQSGSLTIGANLYGDDYRVAAGGARGSLVPGKYTVGGTMKVAIDSADVVTLLGAGTPQSMILYWYLASNRTLKIQMPATYFQKTGPDIQDGPLFADIAFKAAFSTLTTPDTSIQVTIVNGTPGTTYKATS